MKKKHTTKHAKVEDIHDEEGLHHFVRKSLHQSSKKEEKEEILEEENDEVEETEEKKEEEPVAVKKHTAKHHTHKAEEEYSDSEWENEDDLPSAARVTEQLSEIYKNKDGSFPDMTYFQKKKRIKSIRAFFTLLFSCLFLLVVVVSGIYFFPPEQSFSSKEVTISMTGEEAVAAGEVMHYRIRYRNGQNTPLAKSKIVVRYPDGFQFTESSIPPSNDKHDEWDIGTLSSGQGGYIDIYGVLYGSIGTERSFRVFLNYTPANFSSEFQAAGVGKIRITDSPVALSITSPSSSIQGQVVPLVFTLTPRNASSSLKNLALVIDATEGFVKKSSEPQSDNFSDLIWSIPILEGEKSIVVNAAFPLPPGTKEYEIKAKIVGWTDNAKQGDGFVLTEKSSWIAFEESQFSAEFLINGRGDDFSLRPKEPLKTLVRVRNNSATPLSNIRASVTFEAPSFQEKSILDWTALDDKNKNAITGEQLGADIRRGTVSWDKTHISGLAQLAPKAEIPIEFTLPLKTRQQIAYTNFKEHKIRATLDLQYEINGKKQVAVVGPIEMTINSDLSIDVKKDVAHLADGKDQYTISWELLNTFHEVKNVEISAEIFGDITWDEKLLKVPGGYFKFDETTKKLVWKIETLPAETTPQTLQFSFVRKFFNPTQILMMSKIKVTGKDTVTGKDIILLESEIPNAL